QRDASEHDSPSHDSLFRDQLLASREGGEDDVLDEGPACVRHHHGPRIQPIELDQEKHAASYVWPCDNTMTLGDGPIARATALRASTPARCARYAASAKRSSRSPSSDGRTPLSPSGVNARARAVSASRHRNAPSVRAPVTATRGLPSSATAANTPT